MNKFNEAINRVFNKKLCTKDLENYLNPLRVKEIAEGETPEEILIGFNCDIFAVSLILSGEELVETWKEQRRYELIYDRVCKRVHPSDCLSLLKESGELKETLLIIEKSLQEEYNWD